MRERSRTRLPYSSPELTAYCACEICIYIDCSGTSGQKKIIKEKLVPHDSTHEPLSPQLPKKSRQRQQENCTPVKKSASSAVTAGRNSHVAAAADLETQPQQNCSSPSSHAPSSNVWNDLSPWVLSPLPASSMGCYTSVPAQSASSKKSNKPSGDGGDENKQGSNMKSRDYHIVEEVRVQWEREQAKYRKQRIDEDSTAIAALVGGQRRKDDGSRFYVGGVDISFIKGNNEDACACLTVLQMPDLKMVYQRLEMIKLTQPYIPGFLAFREVPPLEHLFSRLKVTAPQYWPDLTLVDGNGVLHPRGFGLACHLGVILDIPTAGVAKSLISAQGITEDEQHKKRKRTLTGAGDGFDLVSDSGQILGKCVQVHDNAPNPVYISAGHKMSLASALWVALECSKYRIPEPVRRADLDSREYLREGKTDPQEFILDEDEDQRMFLVRHSLDDEFQVK